MRHILNITLLVAFALPAFGAEDDRSIFDYQILNHKKRSSTYWYPLMGLGVPGLPQFLNRQTGAGLVYSISGGVGLGVGVGSMVNQESTYESNEFDNLNDNRKFGIWGMQVYQTAGSLSTYHAFRSVAKQRQEQGDFKFLKVEETNDELMLAPFKVKYFLRPTVFVPLGVLAGLVVYFRNQDHTPVRDLSLSDGLFMSGVSYNAGVGEESLFRGYMMMNFRQSWNSDLWSNAATATIFGAAHYSDSNRLPWPQFLVGLYLGWLTQSNDWTLSEAIFLHTWWDVIAISATLAEGVTKQALMLPVANFTF